MVRVLGIDPGFASTGLAVVSQQVRGGPMMVQAIEVVRTEPQKGKAKRDLRVSADDSNRMREIFDAINRTLIAFPPSAVAYEVYQPFKAQGGNAWKCARVEGLVMALALSREIMVMPFLPVDLKTKIGGGRSASKVEIEAAVMRRVVGAEPWLAKIPKSLREHVADALGYAVLGLAEVWQLAALTGAR